MALQLPVYAQGYTTRSWSSNIKSVQIANYYNPTLHPVVTLNEEEFVTLTFDDLSADAATYSYRVVHCNAYWQASHLQETEYMSGFSTNYIDHTETSFNTYFTYNHYELTIPNENWRFTVSGNYAIEVFQDNQQDKPVLTACFSVVDPKVSIAAQATARTNISYENKFQQVNLDVNYTDYDIKDPYNEIIVVVTQNNRQDNRVVLTSADYLERNKLRYLNNNKLIFEAGNQYRVFDISSEKVLSERVQSVDYFDPYFHATLFPDEIRSNRQYDYLQDVHGSYLINVQFSDQSQTDGDYFFTHFTLPVEKPFLDQDVYILGELTGNALTPQGRMTYNVQKQCYEKILLLKQGGYNYLYATVPTNSNKATLQPIEGNFWQTQNEYSIYVFHRPFGSKYDKLIGFSTVIANYTPY